MKKIITFVVLLMFAVQTFAQEVHWAVSVDTVSSEYSYDRHGGKEILGKPNVDQQGRNSVYAWAVVPNDVNKESVEMAHIEVDFGKSFLVEQVAVFESFNPGAVSEIYISSFKADDSNSEGMWERIYADTAVIARTGMSQFEKNIDPILGKVAGTVHKDLNIFKKDSVFQAQTGYKINNVFFEKQNVRRVRIVINPLAIDGWNQIDAVGISKSADSIKYPEPRIVDQSIIIDKKSKNLGTAINSASNELFPVVSPDEKRLYYSKKEFSKEKNIYTQNIWYSDITNAKIYSCNTSRQNNYEKQDVWQTGEPSYWEFNSVVPNSIVGFSANGEYIYLNNLYENLDSCDCEDVFVKNTTGLSVSHLDSVLLVKPEDLNVDSIITSRYNNFTLTSDASILILTKFDSLYNKNNIYVQVKEKKNAWGNPYRIGNYAKAPFTFNADVEGEVQQYWIDVDSLSNDSVNFIELNWSQPKNVVINDYVNQSNYTSFYISPDGEHLFLAIQEDTTKTYGRDIYISFLNEDGITWGKPQNLGLPINTIADESSPFFDGDGISLYFSSAGHDGFGEHDVYICERLDDSWLKWSKPQNLGIRVNTPGSDVNFKIADKSRMGYFSAYEKTVGCNDNSDIFSIQMGKAITIHIKGRTLNVNDNYKPIGNVDIAMNALGETDRLKKIEFKSSKLFGEYDIKITKMIESNKMTKFGIAATKNNAYQTNYSKKAIDYEYIDLTNPDWVVNIHQDLYLYSKPDTNGDFVIVDPIYIYDTVYVETGGYSGRSDTIRESDIITRTDTVPADVVIKYIVDTVYSPIKVEANGCPTIYSAGILYGLQRTEDFSEFVEINASYTKHFGYNQTDVGLNERKFKKLINDLMVMLKKSPDAVINIYIISSASHVPTTAYCSNFELARQRAEEPVRRLKEVLKRKGISEDRVHFDKRYVVEGPDYAGDAKDKAKYRKFQYVKIWMYSCDVD